MLQLLKAKIQKNTSAVAITEKAEMRKDLTKFDNDKKFLRVDVGVFL